MGTAAAELDTIPFPICTITNIRIAFHYPSETIHFFITFSLFETKTTTMSTPTTPVISVTDINDEMTVIEQPREESPSPLPIPPPQNTAEQLAEPIRVVNHTMRNVIVTRDRMIHRLSTATEPLTEEQREALVISLQEFAVEAKNLGLPLIPQEIIEGFLERIHPREASAEIIAHDTLAAAITRLTADNYVIYYVIYYVI